MKTLIQLKSIANRLYASFPEEDDHTIASMLEAYDGCINSYDVYERVCVMSQREINTIYENSLGNIITNDNQIDPNEHM